MRNERNTGTRYGYARISKPKQSIDRQIRNILASYPEAKIIQEAYTGRVMSRPEWVKLRKRLRSGDTVIFDSVSRMSRDAAEGVQTYFELLDSGVDLIFLKEGYIDTAVYKAAIAQTIEATGNEIADLYIEATNQVIRLLAKKQIEKAFEQAEKEAQDIRQRTREGLQTAKLNGKQVGGHRPGAALVTKKGLAVKDIILKHNKDFGGSLSDPECISLAGCSRNTFYKYKRELALKEA